MKEHWISTAAAAALIGVPIPAQASELRLCLVSYRAAIGDRPGQATYRATVVWNPIPGASGHLVVGAYDTSHVVWVQRTYGRIRGTSESDTVDFIVSDESAYPLKFAIYRLNNAAFENYRTACRQSRDCYFAQSEAGVESLTDEEERDRPDEAGVRPDC